LGDLLLRLHLTRVVFRIRKAVSPQASAEF
jgi:hypothetical protein